MTKTAKMTVRIVNGDLRDSGVHNETIPDLRNRSNNMKTLERLALRECAMLDLNCRVSGLSKKPRGG
jgi:hypothetical protein